MLSSLCASNPEYAQSIIFCNICFYPDCGKPAFQLISLQSINIISIDSMLLVWILLPPPFPDSTFPLSSLASYSPCPAP